MKKTLYQRRLENKRISIILALLIICSQFAYAGSANLLTPKMIIRTNIDSPNGDKLIRAIGVKNEETIPINITLQVSPGLKDLIELEKKEFTLQEGEEKWVNFTITIKNPGTYKGEIISIFSTGEEHPIGLSSQIIIIAEGENKENPKSTILTGSIIGDNAKKTLIGTGIIVLILLLLLLIYYKKRISNKKNKSIKKSDRSS